MNNEQVVYEAPRVESILTADALEREVFYAGSNNPSTLIPATPTPTIKGCDGNVNGKGQC